MTSLKKKSIFFVTFIIAIVFVVLMAFGVYFETSDVVSVASADATVGNRVEMIDLWERYPIRVIGPLASKNAAGQYVDENGDRVKDKYGEYTNNIYQIPADQYYNVENYIYTAPNDDGTGGRVLYGWKPNIEPVIPNTGVVINENGYIMSNGSPSTRVGMYVEYVGSIFYGTLQKYALIVPDDVTKIGNGNGAFVTNGNAYYGSSVSNGTVSNAVNRVQNTTEKFSDFGGFIAGDSQSLGLTKDNYFQPRERLAGVYFSQNSKLHTIAGGSDDTDTAMNATSRSGQSHKGKSAFAYCDNMRFFILPDGVKTIGQSAFYKCAQLVDVNIPEAVGSTGGSLGKNAFYGCSSLLHITIPSGVTRNTGVFSGCTKLKDVENLSGSFTKTDFSAASLFNYQTVAKKSALYVVGGEPTYTQNGEVEYDPGVNGFIFCQNVNQTGNGTTDLFATISGYDRYYEKGKWYALGFAGETDTSGTKVYTFPETFNDSSERRKGIKYDYLDAGGHKCKNTIGSTEADTVKNYDVAKDFANGTWCVNIVMPSAIEVIGDSAFNGSHLRYMETYATCIGEKAFAGNTDLDSNQGNAQWYYFHQTGAYQAYRLGSSVFTTLSDSTKHRYIIFENYELYSNASSTFLGNSNWIKYQIPVYVNVYSTDGEQFTVTESNMAKKFYNDSDFGDVTIQKNAWNKIVITKRLSGYSYSYQKQYTGFWAPNDAENQTYPTLSNMSSTAWYSDRDCENKILPTASSNLGIGSLYTTTPQQSQVVNVYTKQISYPEINIKDWTYTEEMDDAANSSKYSFNELLGLSDDYVVEYTSHTNHWLEASTSKHDYVKAAGTYTLTIKLNSDKWGSWKDPDPDKTVVSAEVKQKPIDLGDFENVPKFWVRGTSVLNALSGDNTTIYEYSTDTGTAYYITKRESLIAISTETVSNSYAMYMGQTLRIVPESNWNLYSVVGNENSDVIASESGLYNASFNLSVNNANYKFVYEGLQDSHQAEEFANNKMSYSSQLERTAVLTKRWFIVTPFNWLIDINSVGGPTSINNQYVLAEKDNGDGNYSAIYEWTYDYNDMTIRVNTPKLANGHADGLLSASISRNRTLIASNIDVANLSYYINDAMPAGEYSVIISAKATDDYDAFDTPFTITVKSKELDASAIKNYLTGTADEEKGNVFEKANNNQLFLFDNGEDWQNIYAAINGTLNNNRRKPTANNYWTRDAADGYYSNAVMLKYNLDALQTTTYYNESDLTRFSAVPKSAGQYLVYYSVSASNYITVGETDKEDEPRRSYRFTTVIYNLLSASDLATTINLGIYTYTGSEVYATVPYSVNYTYSFNDETENAYITVNRNHYVTVTINDPLLMRWKDTEDNNITVESNTNTAQVIVVRYSISADINSWQSVPQMTAWAYDGFIKATHTITGTLTYQGAQVYYRLGTRNEDEEYEWLEIGNIEINGIKYFTVNQYGEVEDEAVRTALNELHAGTYYLDSYVAARDVNVTAYDTPLASCSTVVISKASNVWNTTPALTPYQYYRFNSDFVAGVPKYSDASKVLYTVNVGGTDTDLPIKIDTDGTYKLSDDAVDVLNTLPVGIYTLSVALEGTDDYESLSASVLFIVMQSTTNSWKTLSTITGWTYEGYTEALFTDGEADFGTVLYTVQTLKADGNIDKNLAGFENLSFADLQTKLQSKTDTLNAGSYNLYITSKGENADDEKNYVAAIHNVRFAVAKAPNAWQTGYIPTIEGWTYGEAAKTPTEGKTVKGDGEIESHYYTARYENGNWVANAEEVTNIATAGAGMYAYVTTAKESTNYQSITHTAIFEIARAGNSWEDGCEPESTFTWTWGKIDSVVTVNSSFIKAAAKYMTDDKRVTYTITGPGYSDTITKVNTTDLSTIIDGVEEDGVKKHGLRQLGVGNYVITVSVAATDNYAEVSKITYVTVTAASFEWQTEPANSSWTWGVADTQKVFTQPTIKTIADSGVSYTYVVSEKDSAATTTYSGANSFVNMLADLKGNNAAIYTVTVTVSCPNYNDLTKTVEVEIKQATNVWTKNTPAATLVREYENKSFAILKAEAKYGTVVYRYTNGTTPVSTSDINEVNAWINSLDKSETAYVITVEVAEDANGNYTGLSETTLLAVTGVQSHWDNEGQLKASYEFTYDKDKLPSNLATVIIPTKTLTKTGVLANETLSYTIAYENYNGVSTAVKSVNTAAEVTAYLKENASAGVYVIGANYDPHTDNYSKLNYYITVKVNRATPAWDKEILLEYINTYEDVKMPTPTAAGCVVTITVVDSEGKSYPLPADGDLNKHLNTLNVGSYTVTSEVEETDNFLGLAAVNTRVVINPAPNAWKDPDVLKSVWTFNREDTFNIVVPESLRGKVRCIVKSVPLDSSKDLNEYLNDNWDVFTEGDHSLSFVVDKDANDNYNGLVYDCTIRISKKANSWVVGKEPVATYDDWTGTVNTADFKIPEALNYNELLRFDIDKIVGPADIASSHNLTVSAFITELGKLVNGTYRVTMRVGGNCGDASHNSDLMHVAIEKYNLNYVYLEGTTLITITPYANGWDKEFDKTSWTFGESVALTAPQAKYGNDTVTFTVSGTDVLGNAANSGVLSGTEGKTAFEALTAFLADCKAGTYTVTANVASTNVYEATPAATALVSISLADNDWKDSLVANSTINWIYGSDDNEEIKFEPLHDEGNKMVILVNNKKYSEDTLQEYLETLGVGTYVIKATVPATAEYGLMEKIITLNISKSNANGWKLDDDGNELKLEIADKWTWDDIVRNASGWDTGLVTPVPRFGDNVNVTVKKGAEEQFSVTLTYITISGVKTVNPNDVDLLKARLWTLDVATYTITAQIFETDNYQSYTQPAVTFEIEQATNTWKSISDAPHISGWDYSGSTAYPASDPKYGNKNDVVYAYAPIILHAGQDNDDDCLNVGEVTNWDSALPINAGRYYVRGILAGTTNYKELIGYGAFSIGTGTNAWADMPSVIAWNWNGYNREVNQFSASARSGGKVSFSILKQGESESGYVSLSASDFFVYGGAQLTAAQIQLIQKPFEFVTVGGQSTKMISEEIAAILNALKPGTYRLRAVAASTENFDAMEGIVPFVVGKADNEWNVNSDSAPIAPNMLSYSYNSFVESGARASFTAGSSKYGTISYQVTDSLGQVVIATTTNTASLIASLKALNADNYILKSWVPATANDVYKTFYTEAAPYSVLFSVSRIANSWAENGAPHTSVSEFYLELHKDDFDFEGWFGTPQTIRNDEIVYTLLNTDFTTAKSGEYSYDELFEALKALNAGDYIVHMSIAQSTNYVAMTADISVSIKRKENDFTLSSSLSGQWKKEDDVYKTTLDELSFTADYNDNATFTIDNVAYNSYAELEQAINDKKFNAGSYQLTVTVKETNEYEGFTQTVQLDIAQDENEWKNDWTIEESLNVAVALSGAGNIAWTYGTAINWEGARPKYGTLVYVDIRKSGASEAFSYTDVNYADESAAQSSIKNISRVLSTLDGGDYVLTVVAPADINWKQKSDSISFSVLKASNDWKMGNEPALLDATLNEQGVLTYVYGKYAIRPDAAALHGTPVYVYYADGSTTPLKSIPVNAGKYKVDFVVEETTNYEGLSETLEFIIAKDIDESFIVSNGTVGWIYGEYDRLTHVFTGIPRTGGEVSYVVVDSTGKEVVTGIILGDAMGVHHRDFDKDTYVTVADAAKIGALLAGDYRLKINVAETPNYEGFSASTPFIVSPAQNIWTVTPKITPWSLGLWTKENNMPVAESRFGEPVIKIVSRNNNEVFYEATYNRAKGSYDISINRLANAPAGMYVMTAKVAIEAGKYNNVLEETVSLEVYKRGSLDEKNYWYDTPGINPWEANIIKLVNKPYGTPLRGLPYFEFYHSMRDENNEIVIDWDNPVVAGEDSFLVEKGDNVYYKDFYMPMAPGYYYMVACAISLDGDGHIIAADTLIEKPIQFQIRNRENSFKDEPRIDTLLFLGERDTWAAPTAEAMLYDSEIIFKYKNILTGEDLGTAMPTADGRYSVTAYAFAKYSEMIEKSVEFVVELSTNEWIDHPTIDAWTEEFGPNDPFATAQYGSDKIVYTYENLATGEIRTEKPMEEGTYRLIATVELAGFKTLVGTTTFTVGPAFDHDLLVVDIILATVCCGLAIGLMCIAIRKKRNL